MENSANGHIRFTVPSSPGGVDVADVELTFADGVVREARAERGQAYLDATLDADAGARRLGEIGIGTNFGIDRAVGSILLDEKIGGTVHLAVGPLLPGDRRRQRLLGALGPDLRPARRRHPEGRRRDHPA